MPRGIKGTGTVELVCQSCGNAFQRRRAEHVRNSRRGNKVFCSMACSAVGNDNFGDNRNTDTSHLDPANQRDEFSDFRYYERKIRERRSMSNRADSNITVQEIKAQWDKQAGRCAYTGIQLYTWKQKKRPEIRRWEEGSLDRIDSALPYTAGNVQFVSCNINFLKHDMSDQDTRDLIDVIRKSQ